MMGGAYLTDAMAQSQNILPNGSFESEAMKDGKPYPESWGFFPTTDAYTGAMVLGDKSQVHSGENAVSITGDETAQSDTSTMWMASDPIKVTPDTAYSLSGWIKTANCNGKGAWLWIIPFEKIASEDGEVVEGEISCASPYAVFTGTEDWQEWSAEIHVKGATRWLRIACRLDGPGTATFDDILLLKE